MKTGIRWIAVLSLAVMCLSALSACKKEPSENIEEPTETLENDELKGDSPESEKENQPTLLDPANAMILVENNQTSYNIVRDNDASASAKEIIKSFRNRFSMKTGVDIKTKDDKSEKKPKEIMISMMDGRTEPAQEYAKLTAPQKKGYRICIVGESIVVASQEEYLKEALDLLMLAISDCGNGIWGIPKGYEGEMDIPEIQSAGKMYSVGEGNYAYNVDRVTQAVVDDFMGQMESDGFDLYSAHSVGNSQFATYIKDSIYGQMVVYTMYHPDIQKFRLTYGPMEYLPNVTQLDEDNKADASITQLFMEMIYGTNKLTVSNSVLTKNENAPGMSYVIQLSDGRFIVIDGGNADGQASTVTYNKASGKWEVSAESHASSDAKRLYDTMNSMKPAAHDKPQIAVWFISHAHADHWNLAYNFLNDYKNKIELDVLAFNFPEKKNACITDTRWKRMNEFKELAKTGYGANLWNMHTGQVMELPGATVEVLSTVEDFYCDGNMIGLTDEIEINNTSITFRIMIGDMSFMVLGDAYSTTCQFMADAYGAALRSDILQVSHHGYNGAVLDLYQDIDPKICFWPCDDYGFNDAVRLGENGAYYFNYWLRNTKWKREKKTGTRIHYVGSYTTTIDVATGNVTKQ